MKKIARRQLYDQVKSRDGHACRMCATTLRLTIHHIVPKSSGGKDEKENLIVLCEPCHVDTHRAYSIGFVCPDTFQGYLEAMRITNDVDVG